MASVRVGFEALAGESARLDALAGEMADRVASAERAVSGLIGSGWQGASADAFDAAFGQWCQAARAGTEVLARLAAGVRATGAEFAAAEQANQAASRRLEAGLPGGGFGIAAMMGGR